LSHQSLKYARQKEIQNLKKAYIKQATSLPDNNKDFSRRRWQLQQIKAYQSKGVAIKAMARLLNMSRNTVKSYLHLQQPPQCRSFIRVNIAPFDRYIRTTIKEQPNIAFIQLYREIKQRGYNGARSTACLHFHKYINRTQSDTPPKLPNIFDLPSKIPYLLLSDPYQLSCKERKLVANLSRKCPQIKTASLLASQFGQMMKNKQDYHLQRWIERAVSTGIKELSGFAKG
jgi:hypothetical protein